jgi:protein-S-isoprenylcysteine O-methyltransferase Ste14
VAVSIMIRAVVATAMNSAIFTAMLLGPSRLITGGWDWRRGWLAVAVCFAETVIGTLFFLITDPTLVRERTSARGQSSADRCATLLIGLLMTGWFLAAASDIHLGPMLPAPPPVISFSLGLAVHFFGLGLIVWTFRVNSFAAAVVRIQAEQRVIETGPYAIVRHPMYLGAIFWLAGLALVLESTATALVTLPVIVLGFLPRMKTEEAILSRDLPGYADYQSRVRARILPGVF